MVERVATQPYRLYILCKDSKLIIDHFTVVSLVTWPWIVSEAGVDLVLIETSLLFICKSCCSYANYRSFHLHKKSSEVSIKTRVNPSLAFNPSQDTKHTTVKWPITVLLKTLLLKVFKKCQCSFLAKLFNVQCACIFIMMLTVWNDFSITCNFKEMINFKHHLL